MPFHTYIMLETKDGGEGAKSANSHSHGVFLLHCQIFFLSCVQLKPMLIYCFRQNMLAPLFHLQMQHEAVITGVAFLDRF